jgi:hypothetical protein
MAALLCSEKTGPLQLESGVPFLMLSAMSLFAIAAARFAAPAALGRPAPKYNPRMQERRSF